MFRVAGAFVAGSVTWANSPSLYFAQMSSVYATGIEKWRKPTTALRSFSVSVRGLHRVHPVHRVREREARIHAGGVVVLAISALQIVHPFVIHGWGGEEGLGAEQRWGTEQGEGACSDLSEERAAGVVVEMARIVGAHDGFSVPRGGVESPGSSAQPFRPVDTIPLGWTESTAAS